ncbi:hypothetical protein SERLA73DRAFT_80279 [Serpula lacrymans var. lacrymans S7.3]|uniref:Aspartic peptidase DDI1-type domain-containing protein n=1 Tax=Serpula lacrymans var. lacrymans (strain S7.3) TaxID=936435 RepID=F8QJ97_SERL3|nr:hypothetical protein SERLA73DRAFT_80279 [Serpula lacrymans var. lacrymans S7.3]
MIPVPIVKFQDQEGQLCLVELNNKQIKAGRYPALERNVSIARDTTRVLPQPIVIVVHMNGHPARALIDTGSLADFMSSTLAKQIGVQLTKLSKPSPIQLAVQGSRSKVTFGSQVDFAYQRIKEKYYFDIINLQNYDLILGTPFLYQHQVMVGFNSSKIVIGSDVVLPLKGEECSQLKLRATKLREDDIEQARAELREYACPLCTKASETGLPPLQDINHSIPLIDENKIYPWQPSRCPEPLQAQWSEKREAYLATGRWNVTSAGNTVPMLLIPKPGSGK